MKKKILIVEDNPAINRVLLLLNYRYETIPAINGKHAGEIAVTKEPDLILMDMIMPGMNGFQAALPIRENPKTSSIPIIAVTALSSFEEK